jgi:hypothetical protein
MNGEGGMRLVVVAGADNGQLRRWLFDGLANAVARPTSARQPSVPRAPTFYPIQKRLQVIRESLPVCTSCPLVHDCAHSHDARVRYLRWSSTSQLAATRIGMSGCRCPTCWRQSRDPRLMSSLAVPSARMRFAQPIGFPGSRVEVEIFSSADPSGVRHFGAVTHGLCLTGLALRWSGQANPHPAHQFPWPQGHHDHDSPKRCRNVSPLTVLSAA